MSAGSSKRSTSNLLRAAKTMIRNAEKTSDIVCLSSEKVIRVHQNKRITGVRDYVKLSPSEFMAWWMTTYGANRKASNVVLHYMKYRFNAKIPTDYRTLLKTPSKPIETVMHPGNYIHIGVHAALEQLLSEAGLDVDNVNTTILMQFFIDGLVIFRSTKDGFWVIMVNLRNVSARRLTPKVIGVYHGLKKATNFNDFLWPSVVEINEILDHGIVFKNKVLKPKILNFVLDAPARSSCKAVKAVTGYFGCDVCTTEGDYIHNRMAFLDLDAPLRNDTDFRGRVYDDYHHMESVLEMLPIDMIDSFPLDYLHCVLLGVENWILKFLRDTPKTFCARDYLEIGRRIEKFNLTQPVEFQRKLRSFIDNLGHMKGTELRQYVLYIGPLLLMGLVGDDIIGNLIKLQIASIIFSHKRFANYYNEADTLMRMFVVEFAAIYHPCHVVYVVHALCHMKRFVERYGPWDNFSTFEYETYNNTVKGYLKSDVKPLVQVTNRIVEIYNAPKYDSQSQSPDIEISGQQGNGTYAKLKFFDLVFKAGEVGQNLVLLKSGRGVKLSSIQQNENGVILTGKPFKYCESVYNEVDTRRFNVFKSCREFDTAITFNVTDIDGKLWELPIPNSNSNAYFPIYVEDGKSFSGTVGVRFAVVMYYNYEQADKFNKFLFMERTENTDKCETQTISRTTMSTLVLVE